jgi:hypothetical protein
MLQLRRVYKERPRQSQLRDTPQARLLLAERRPPMAPYLPQALSSVKKMSINCLKKLKSRGSYPVRARLAGGGIDEIYKRCRMVPVSTVFRPHRCV